MSTKQNEKFHLHKPIPECNSAVSEHFTTDLPSEAPTCDPLKCEGE